MSLKQHRTLKQARYRYPQQASTRKTCTFQALYADIGDQNRTVNFTVRVGWHSAGDIKGFQIRTPNTQLVG